VSYARFELKRRAVDEGVVAYKRGQRSSGGRPQSSNVNRGMRCREALYSDNRAYRQDLEQLWHQGGFFAGPYLQAGLPSGI
jgi:hypothetical protein